MRQGGAVYKFKFTTQWNTVGDARNLHPNRLQHVREIVWILLPDDPLIGCDNTPAGRINDPGILQVREIGPLVTIRRIQIDDSGVVFWSQGNTTRRNVTDIASGG